MSELKLIRKNISFTKLYDYSNMFKEKFYYDLKLYYNENMSEWNVNKFLFSNRMYISTDENNIPIVKSFDYDRPENYKEHCISNKFKRGWSFEKIFGEAPNRNDYFVDDDTDDYNIIVVNYNDKTGRGKMVEPWGDIPIMRLVGDLQYYLQNRGINDPMFGQLAEEYLYHYNNEKFSKLSLLMCNDIECFIKNYRPCY